MVPSIFLTDSAFAALQNEKRPGESDSDVILRLLRVTGRPGKNPWHFLRAQSSSKGAWSPEEHQKILKETKEQDRHEALRRWRERYGGT